MAVPCGISFLKQKNFYIVPRSTNDFSTGIINYVNENDVTVAPNPAVDQIRISVSNDQFQVSHCYI
ncbi:MAG: hypothetical protein IIT64_01900, partial [Bacteroidaceae bacterium]|nr:hypothetical protein [Bacteroidaceae bacterium]